MEASDVSNLKTVTSHVSPLSQPEKKKEVGPLFKWMTMIEKQSKAERERKPLSASTP